MKRMLFVMNAHTGGNRLKNNLLAIINLFAKTGYEITVHPTQGPGDATDVVKTKGRNYDLVVCCGGDGTLNEVVEGAMQLETPPVVGYIPGGTTNDFASSLKIPKTNMLKAAERIAHPREIFHCDVGVFNDRYFNYVAAFGAFTDVSYSTPQKSKNVMGYLAYLIEAVSKLPTIHPFKVRIHSGEKVLEEDFILGMVSNSASVAGFSFIDKKQVHLDDGLFEVLLVRSPQKLSDLGALSGALMTKDFNSPFIETLCIKELQIYSQQPMSWTLDGEFGGKLTEASISVKKQALPLCL